MASGRLLETRTETSSVHLSSVPKQQMQRNGTNNNGYYNYDGETPTVLKKTISQFCAISASSLLTLSYGISIGFSTMLISELYKKDGEIVVTIGELSWISSMNYFSIPLGAVASGPISQRLGRRNLLILTTLPYIGSWLLFRYSGHDVWVIFVAFLLLGTTGGVVESPVQIYVTEISEPRLRGSISASVSATIMLGIFLQVLVGSYVHWRTLALVNLAFPLAALLALTLVPESPHWLANKGRIDEAKRALCWLRGWTSPRHVRHEFESMLESTSSTDAMATRIVATCSRTNLKRYFQRTVWLPFALVSFAFFIACFNGSVSALTYSVPLFRRLESPIDEYTATIILAGLQLLASVLLVLVVPRTGKRIPTFASLVVAGTAMLVVAIYAFLHERQIIEGSSSHHTWIPSSMLILSIFATALGIKSTPWILAGEVFPCGVRGVVTGLVGSTCNIYAALASKFFLYALDALTLPGTFLLFTGVNFVGLAVLWRVMPETEGYSLAEIERHFAGTATLSRVHCRSRAETDDAADLDPLARTPPSYTERKESLRLMTLVNC